MSRPLRIEWPGGLYHVTSRGNRLEPIVEDDDDRLAWVALLGQTCERFGWRVYAWCLMADHYHVLLETPKPNLSLGMRHLNGVWSQAFNRRHLRVGHVFQGRFKAVMVERECFLLELARHVVLNPVRIGVADDAAGYPWSSYRATAGDAPVPAWLDAQTLLRCFASSRQRAIAGYVEHVHAGIGHVGLWDALRGQVFLGNEAFVARMQASLGDDSTLRDVPRRQRRPLKRPLAEFAAASESRDKAMALAFQSGEYRQREIADFFGVHETTVSRAVRRIRESAQVSLP